MISEHLTTIESGKFDSVSIGVEAVVSDVLTGTDGVHVEEVILISLHTTITKLSLAINFPHEPLVRFSLRCPSILLEFVFFGM